MPTLKAMFQLYDGYSATITKAMAKTDAMAQKLLGASRNADGFNDSLKNTEAAAGSASTGLTKLIGTVASLAAVKKTMDMTDIYINTNSRLSMITDTMEEQKALQQDIFAAANRARGSYTEMANASAKLKMLAGDSFSNNQEAVIFTELLTKSLKVSGAGQAEQDSAFLQLTQAMTSGRLQGDEFRSVMENAPMVADAIARYMGITKGELKELSSKGVITSDIIKNVMFQAADDINGKFAQMPMTFADVWNRIKNAGTSAFGEIFTRLNRELNSVSGQKAVDSIVSSISVAARYIGILIDGVMWFFNAVSNNWGMLQPIVMAVVGAFIAYNVVLGITNGLLGAASAAQGLHSVAMAAQGNATFMATVQQYGFNTALLACPLTWFVGLILLVVAGFYAGVAAVNHFTGATLSGTGIICGALNVVKEFFVNAFLVAWNVIVGLAAGFAALGLNMVAAFSNAIANIESFFYSLLATALTVIAKIAEQLSKLPFVEFDTSGIASAADAYAAKAEAIQGSKAEYRDFRKAYDDASGRKNNYGAFKDGWAGDAYDAGYGFGSNLGDKVSSLFSAPAWDGSSEAFQMPDVPSYGSISNPATVKGAGKNGSIEVNIADEDIQYLRDLAERDYVAKIATNTLAPNIKVEFTGPITQEADVDAVAAHVGQILRDEIDSTAEGVY